MLVQITDDVVVSTDAIKMITKEDATYNLKPRFVYVIHFTDGNRYQSEYYPSATIRDYEIEKLIQQISGASSVLVDIQKSIELLEKDVKAIQRCMESKQKGKSTIKNRSNPTTGLTENSPVSALDLPFRIEGALRRSKVETIGDLLPKTKTQLLNMDRIGNKCLCELVKAIHDAGFHFINPVVDNIPAPEED